MLYNNKLTKFVLELFLYDVYILDSKELRGNSTSKGLRQPEMQSTGICSLGLGLH